MVQRRVRSGSGRLTRLAQRLPSPFRTAQYPSTIHPFVDNKTSVRIGARPPRLGPWDRSPLEPGPNITVYCQLNFAQAACEDIVGNDYTCEPYPAECGDTPTCDCLPQESDPNGACPVCGDEDGGLYGCRAADEGC